MTVKANNSAGDGRDFTRGMAGMTSATLVTKVLGYARDALLVAVFGAGPLADAYYAALRLVNVFRRTGGEGALNAVFIPMLEREKLKPEPAAREFFSSAWTVIFILSLVLALAGILFREQFVLLSAWGFKGSPEQFRVTALLAAVMMPQLLFVNISALFTAALNSARKFFLPALAPAAFSLAVIAVLLGINYGFFASLDGRGRILLVAGAASLSGIVQALALVPGVLKAGYNLKFKNPLNGLAAGPALLAAAPAAVTLAQDQVSLLINTVYASFLTAGSVTAIYNSARLVQFPISLFAAAAAAVSLPELAGRNAAGDMPGFRRHLAGAMSASWLIMLPAAAGIGVTALPVCRALFEHGKFTPEASLMTAQALLWLASGLPAYGINKISASSLYALGRQAAPLSIISAQLALNAILCLPLMRTMGVGGLMLATSVSSWAAAIAFLMVLKRHSGFSPLKDLPLLKPALCTAASALAAFALKTWLEPAGPLAATAAAVPGAVAVYFAGLRILGVEERRFVTGGRF